MIAINYEKEKQAVWLLGMPFLTYILETMMTQPSFGLEFTGFKLSLPAKLQNGLTL